MEGNQGKPARQEEGMQDRVEGRQGKPQGRRKGTRKGGKGRMKEEQVQGGM